MQLMHFRAKCCICRFPSDPGSVPRHSTVPTSRLVLCGDGRGPATAAAAAVPWREHLALQQRLPQDTPAISEETEGQDTPSDFLSGLCIHTKCIYRCLWVEVCWLIRDHRFLDLPPHKVPLCLIFTGGVKAIRYTFPEVLLNPVLSDSFGFPEEITSLYFLIFIFPTGTLLLLVIKIM